MILKADGVILWCKRSRLILYALNAQAVLRRSLRSYSIVTLTVNKGPVMGCTSAIKLLPYFAKQRRARSHLSIDKLWIDNTASCHHAIRMAFRSVPVTLQATAATPATICVRSESTDDVQL